MLMLVACGSVGDLTRAHACQANALATEPSPHLHLTAFNLTKWHDEPNRTLSLHEF